MTAAFKSTPENQRDVDALRAYLDKQPHGSKIGFVDIERAVSVRMNPRGRGLLQRALKGRPYASIRGYGIELSSPTNSVEIVSAKVRRVRRAISGTSKTVDAVLVRHGDEMHKAERERLSAIQSLTGFMLSHANAQRALAAKKEEQT